MLRAGQFGTLSGEKHFTLPVDVNEPLIHISLVSAIAAVFVLRLWNPTFLQMTSWDVCARYEAPPTMSVFLPSAVTRGLEGMEVFVFSIALIVSARKELLSGKKPKNLSKIYEIPQLSTSTVFALHAKP